MKLRRYTPCPVLVHPTLHPDVPALRKQGLICLGPYHNDKWYIFHPKGVRSLPAPQPATLRERVCGFTNKLFRR